MSGHSKWATIKHKKGAADAKRGKLFSKLSKEIMVCAKQGGGDIDMNPSLRTIVQKAKSANMPADNIQRAIKKGTGDLGDVTFEEIVYEGYAAGGVGLVVKVLTDNKNRSAAEIRHIFSRNGSSFASVGSVSRGFERKGQIFVKESDIEEDKLMDIVLEAGAEDMKTEDGLYEIITDPKSFSDVMEALEKNNITTQEADISMISLQPVPVVDVDVAKSIMRFISALEDNDDVQNVYNNADFSDEVMKALSED